jgi:D-alanine-D-alanine ligase
MTSPSPARKYAHVAVLMGGWSAEREVSLRSGAACADALEQAGYRVTRIDVDRNIAGRLAEVKPDACFNALHGRWGEDGCIQGILECLAIPYTHSGVLASSLAMHKGQAKRVLAAAGVPVAEDAIVDREAAAATHALPPPYVAKPVAEGSSVGVVIVAKGANAPPAAIRDIPAMDGLIMIERYVAGRELTCGVIGDRVTDIIEIVPEKGLEFYDYEAKYAPGGPLRRYPRRHRGGHLPGGQHPAGHDGHVTCAGTRAARRDVVRRSRDVGRRGCLARPVIPAARPLLRKNPKWLNQRR